MSWLYSIVLAGLMFSTESNLPVPKNTNYTETATKQVIKLDEVERFEKSYPLNSNGRVSVSNVNGSIVVETWDRNEVKLTAVKTADDRERLADVEIVVDSTPNYLSVETNYDNWKDRNNQARKNWGKLTVEYTLTVPRNAVLNEIETVNGSVRISNATNTVKASAVNGEVRATNLRGATNLSSVNGAIEADFDQLQTGSRITLDTVNGTVNLMVPSDANATFRAESVNGNITNDFGLPVRKGQYVGRDLYGKVGSGDVQIKLGSVNGALSIKRKNDGKNPNAPVNLLPQKSEDDDDWDDDDSDEDKDDDGDSFKAMAKAQKDLKNAQKDITKETRNAQREIRKAAKEVNKIKPEIAKSTADAIKQTAESINQTGQIFNSREYQQKLEEALLKQQESFANISNSFYLAGSPVIEKKSDTFVVKGTPKVTVDALNCAVSVRGWDRNEVKYFVTKISRNRNQTPIQFTANHTDSTVNISVSNEAGGAQKSLLKDDLNRVLVEVYVPKKSNLRIVTNREIRVEGVTGELDLNGTEGAINVRDSNGKLRASTECAKIRVIGFDGEVDAKTISGTVSLEGNFQKISGKSEEGNFILTLPANANADIEANTEEISIENLPAPKNVAEGSWRFGKGGAKYTFTVVEGQVFVRSADALRTS